MDKELTRRLSALRADIQTACKEGGWQDVPRIVAVTKTLPPQAVNPLAALGVLDVGENRVQEILEKRPLLDPKFRVHLIGRLQTNKVKYIMNQVCMIHSLDRMELAAEISKRARQAGLQMDVLVQVNIAGEAQKAGVAPGEAEAFLRACAPLPGLRLRGLMAMMPLSKEAETLRPLFRDMRRLFDSLARGNIPGVRMEELSMGMSQDYRIAAQEGATMVRVGSALFGARDHAGATS